MPISEQWAEVLKPGLREIFLTTVEELVGESQISNLFDVLTSKKAQEEFMGVGSMRNWQEYKGAIEYDEYDEGYKTTIVPAEYADGFKVERKLVDDDLYNIINERPQQLAMAGARTRETHAASVFNNAFSSSYQGGDAAALCATHPLSASRGGTHSNAGSTALSYDAVVETRRKMREYTDDRGYIMPVNPDAILVPPELEETAFSVFETMNKPDTADYRANFVRSRLRKVIVWDYLTDANNWFMLDLAFAKRRLKWVDRITAEFEMDPTSNFRLEARFRGYMRYAYGWSDWRWIYGHAVS